MQEKEINVLNEQNEQSIELLNEQFEQNIDLRQEAIDVITNTDYGALNNKPKINDVELVGNLSTSDLGINVPTKTSDLQNDSDFVVDASYVHTDNNFTNEYKTAVDNTPTKVSELDNDSGFITMSDIPSNDFIQLTNNVNLWELDTGNYINFGDFTLSYYDENTTIQTFPTSTSYMIKVIRKVQEGGNLSDLDIDTEDSKHYKLLQIYVPEMQLGMGALEQLTTTNDLTNYSLTTKIQADKQLTGGVEYIVGTQDTATNLWTGVSTDVACKEGTLYTGKVIIYHLPVAGTSTASTLNLTLPDGTTTGGINVYRLATTTVTTTFVSGCDILMVYDGTNWKVNAYVDTNDNTVAYRIRTVSAPYKNGASTTAYRYQLLVETLDGLEAFTSTSNKTTATKTQLSPEYIPGGTIRYYSTTTSVSPGANFGVTYIWQQYALDMRYSFNISSTEFTAGDPVYIKMSVNNNGTLSPVYNASSGGHPLVTSLPTTADGYVYLYLGRAYSGYQIELEINHPMYHYTDGKIKLWQG